MGSRELNARSPRRMIANMKKIHLKKFGIDQDFPLQDFTLSDPIDSNVIIEHELMGFNPVDYKIVEGRNLISEKIKDKLPWTPGFDICGHVIKTGPHCQKLKVGDRVCGMIGFPLQGGGYATHSVASENELALVPDKMDARLALTCCLSGLTALESYDYICDSQNKILILGATGGVGFSLINISQYFGRRSFGSYRSPEGYKYLSSYNAITPVSVNELSAFFENNSAIDVIDLVGGELVLGLMKEHKNKIKHIVTVPSSTAQEVLEAAIEYDIQAYSFIVKSSAERMNELIKIKNQNQLKFDEGRIFPLERISEVFRTYQKHDFKGKIFVDPS
jgi:NADPH:quinone reductase